RHGVRAGNARGAGRHLHDSHRDDARAGHAREMGRAAARGGAFGVALRRHRHPTRTLAGVLAGHAGGGKAARRDALTAAGARPTGLRGRVAQRATRGCGRRHRRSGPVTRPHRRAFVSLVLRHRLPAMFWAREYVDEGGLMTYSANLADLRRRAATYVDKILKGAKPADLPVEQPTTFELVINLKAAKALGLTLPPALLLRADETVE